MPAVELPPFSEAHRKAVASMRFCTPNVSRTLAWAWTDDVELVQVLVPGAGMTAAEQAKQGVGEHARVASATHYRRCSEPLAYEWEVHITHPDGVAYICDLVDERNA
jgi:hypothetical protein